MQLSFTDFLVYISVLGEEINKLQVVSGMEEKTPIESTRQLLNHLMPAHGFTVQEVPENDNRGLYEHAQDILLHGRLSKYEPDTAEPVDPAYIDMLSDTDETNDRKAAINSGLQKKFQDKWEILA